MSGLLSGLLTAVAIVGAVFTGGTLGIVAGALMATSFAAQQGWLGGGLKKFFSSGIGQGLTTAVGLASVAMGAYSAINSVSSASDAAGAAATTNTAATADQAANASDMGMNAAAQATGNAAGTSSGFLAQNGTGLTNYANTLAQSSPDMQAASGLSSTEIASTNQALDSAWVNAGSPGAGAPVDPAAATTAAQNLQINAPSTVSSNATAAAQNAVNPTANVPNVDTSIPQNTSPTGMAQENGLQGQGAGGAGAPAASGKPGLLSQAISAVNKNPGLATVGGQMISGIAQGISNQKMIQEQIAAQQWGNMQWENPGQVQALESAAAAPITVPQGFLNRASALRGLSNGNNSSTGPVTGVQPGQTGAPAPTVAPLGMGGQNPGGGPVPVAGMGATPRGGVI